MSFKSNIWKIYLFKFFYRLHFIGGIIIPFFTQWGGLNFFQIMVLQSWFMLWIFILEIPTGTVADCFGRKTSIIFSSIACIAAVIVYTSISNFYIFMIGEFLWALSSALMSGADDAFVYDSLKKIGKSNKSKKIFGRIESFGLLGIMIGAPLGSIFAANYDLRTPVLLMAVPFSIAFIIALTFKEPKTSKKVESKRYINTLKKGVKFFYKNKILKILAIDMVSISAIAYFMIWFYQIMLKNAGINIAYFGIIHSTLVVSEILVMNNYERFEKLLGSKKRFVTFSSLITGIMFIVGGITALVPFVLLSIIIGGGFGLTREPLLSSYMNKYIPSSQRATVISTISMFRQFVLVIVNPIVGLMVDWSLSYTMIILGVIAIIFSFVSRIEESHLID